MAASTTTTARRVSRRWIFSSLTGNPIPWCSSIGVSPTFTNNASRKRKRYGWHHTTWRPVPSCGSCRFSATRARYSGGTSPSCSIPALGCRCAPTRSVNSWHADARARSSSTRTGLKPCFPTPTHSWRPRQCSSSPPAYNRPSASMSRSTTHSPSPSP
jgi:hypothetical protein